MKRVYEGLSVLLKYAPDGYFAAEHDEVFAEGVNPNDISKEDLARLNAAGWTWDKGLPAWHKFV